jgi:hypothetical protein
MKNVKARVSATLRITAKLEVSIVGGSLLPIGISWTLDSAASYLLQPTFGSQLTRF